MITQQRKKIKGAYPVVAPHEEIRLIRTRTISCVHLAQPFLDAEL